ncbi:MAG: hypothetical protein WC752_02530 [Patescibacteria group bacterium]|jgi:hypothetical protein
MGMGKKKKNHKKIEEEEEKENEEIEEIQEEEDEEPEELKADDAAKIAFDKAAARNKKRKSEKILDIYREASKKDVDMTKLERKPIKRKGKIVFGIIVALFILAGASLAGFFVFNKDFDNRSESKAELTINSVDAMASGDQLTLEVQYENKESVAISEGTVTVHYPEGFYFKKSEPEASSSDNTWNISNVAAGAAGKIKITGQLVGELNEDKEFTGILTYKPANFNSEFQDTVNKKIKINDTIVTLTTSLPELAFSGQEIEYKVTFKNTSSLPLPNAKVELKYPETFTPSTADPEADINDNIWKFDELKSNEEKTITIKGAIEGKSKENKEFKFSLGLEEPDGSVNMQVEKTNLVLMVNPKLNLTISGPQYVKAKDSLEYKITVENPSDTTIDELELNLKFTDGFLEKNEVALDKITDLKSKESKEISYKAVVNSNLAPTATSLKAVLAVRAAKVEGQSFSFDTTAECESKVKGELKFEGEARYYDDDLTKLGTGPIPPQVGETTSYVIWWTVSTLGGEATNVEITTTLPAYIDGVETSDSSIKYDKDTDQVKWTINKLSAEETKKVAFTIFVTPTSDQLNKVLVLTQETVLNATDSNTKENISQNQERLTSDLPNDPVASGQGVVEKNE